MNVEDLLMSTEPVQKPYFYLLICVIILFIYIYI